MFVLKFIYYYYDNIRREKKIVPFITKNNLI